MNESAASVKVRPLHARDIDAVLTIDALIRREGKIITYASLTTARVLTAETKTGRFKRSTSYYLDLVSGDVPGSEGIGFVAEVEGHVRGFVMARTESQSRSTPRLGRILIIGVQPEFQHRGIAAQLLNSLYERFHSEGVKEVKAEVHPSDKELLAFLEAMGFSSVFPIELTKALPG
jgi:ribosomal protein S18 acetylase RimI-like enzyme